jgi:putative endonuclease
MNYYVYLLWSIQWKRSYVGHTEDIENRLMHHNSGFVRSTKAYRPWLMIHVEEYATRVEAMKRESWLKSPSGRKWIAGFIEKWQETGLSVSSRQSRDGRDRDPASWDRTKPA